MYVNISEDGRKRGMIMLDKIVFGVLTPEMIRKMSAAKINKTDLYDQEGYPIEGGLMDPRLGVIDPGLRCRTCGGSVGECQGHFGHLELTSPVVHVHYTKLIYNILKTTCYKCGRVLLDETGIKKFNSSKKSLKRLKTLVKSKCPYCNEPQRKIKFLKPTTYIEDGTILTATQIREKLERIPDSDLIYLGMRNVRPEWFIITILPIPPVTVRPSITLETGERSEDDLTHKLVDIVRINKRLSENIDLGAPEFIIQDLWELLQYHVATYMNNELSGVPPARHRSGCYGTAAGTAPRHCAGAARANRWSHTRAGARQPQCHRGHRQKPARLQGCQPRAVCASLASGSWCSLKCHAIKHR